MLYNFDQNELGRIADLLHVDVDSLRKRLAIEDDFTIIAIFDNFVKVRTQNGSEIILTLNE